ncbi:MAG: hypothetical protein KDB24_04435, partial [Microthrixaceae bacterium]|nr:hypothetical protein [Microthrixaceae bacterium]
MSSLPQRMLQAVAAVFSVRVALAFMSSSAVTAGVAGPLALQALSARSSEAAAVESGQPPAGGLSGTPDA